MASSPPGPSVMAAGLATNPVANSKPALMQSSNAIPIPTRTSSTSHSTTSGPAAKRAAGQRQLGQMQLQQQAADALTQSPPSASANASAHASANANNSNPTGSQSISASNSQSQKRKNSHRNSRGSSLLPWASTIMSSKQQPQQQQSQPPPPPPPPDPSRYATEDFNFGAKRTWSADKERVVRGPFDYLSEHPGKDFRALLVMAFDAWLLVPPASLSIITKVVGMLHSASLLVDDVEDFSLLRRGFPVAHSIFGVPQTINSANYIYFCALQELQKLHNPKAITIFVEELLNLHRGQGMDLFWRDTLTCPTEDDYLEMVGNKTGGLFRLGIKLMQAESRSPTDFVPLVNLVGLIFQIGDDYKNLWSREYTDNKGMCEDLTEGKFSFPVIHSIRSDPANLQLLNILKQKTSNEEIKRYAVAYMESTGSFEYTRRVVAVLISRARRLAEELDEGRGQTKGVHKILDKMVIT